MSAVSELQYMLTHIHTKHTHTHPFPRICVQASVPLTLPSLFSSSKSTFPSVSPDIQRCDTVSLMDSLQPKQRTLLAFQRRLGGKNPVRQCAIPLARWTVHSILVNMNKPGIKCDLEACLH